MRKIIVAAAVATVMPVAALAHHGWSSYDANNVLTLKGAIVESRYENPHGELVLEDSGKRWLVTLAPVSRMQARGLPREAVAIGKTVTVVGYPSRVKEGEMRAERITAEGKTVELR